MPMENHAVGSIAGSSRDISPLIYPRHINNACRLRVAEKIEHGIVGFYGKVIVTEKEQQSATLGIVQMGYSSG